MRLTRRNEVGVGSWADRDYCADMETVCNKFNGCGNCPVARLIDRLCEYEETGFEPEDINKMYRIALLNAADLVDRIEMTLNKKQEENK